MIQVLSYLKQIYTSLNKRALGLMLLLLLSLLAGLLIMNRSAGAPPSNNFTKERALDLLNGQDWSHFAGAVQNDQGVHIKALDRKIVSLDGSSEQPNPQVNVRGPRLLASGNFKIAYTASNIPSSGSAAFYLYGSVPIIYDEWRYESPQLRIDINRSQVTAYIWDGNNGKVAQQKSWLADVSSEAEIVIIKQDSKLTVALNDKQLGDLLYGNIFQSGNIWFGADATAGSSGWTLKSLKAVALKGGEVQVAPAAPLKISSVDPESLRSLSANHPRKLPMGTAVSNYALFGDSDYRKLVATQFSLITTENELKPQFVHPQPNTYSFAEADSLADFAKANNMNVHGHTLVFSEANPVWMQNTLLAERQKVMTDHISTIVRHFAKDIQSWDVVNEPLLDEAVSSSDLRRNLWFLAMGENYIDIAFKTAREANPSAKLYINEYGLEEDGERWDAFLALIKRLKARGVPIDGVGFQAHIYELADEVNRAVLESHMKTLASLGLESRISEIDVYGDNVVSQAQQYADVLKACLTVPSCSSFSSWGPTDKYGSTTDIGIYPLFFGNNLVWDENLQPKPAYPALQATLRR